MEEFYYTVIRDYGKEIMVIMGVSGILYQIYSKIKDIRKEGGLEKKLKGP